MHREQENSHLEWPDNTYILERRKEGKKEGRELITKSFLLMIPKIYLILNLATKQAIYIYIYIYIYIKLFKLRCE